MSRAAFSLQAIRHERLSAFCLSAAPAWVWSEDGEHLLWANAAGRAFFQASSDDALRARVFGPADPYRRLMKQLALRLSPSGAMRLERLRGFGAPLGGLMTCGCARIALDGENGILIAAGQPGGKIEPFADRLLALIEDIEEPAAAFVNGRLENTNAAACAHDDAWPELSKVVLPAHFPEHSSPISTPLGAATVHRAGVEPDSALIVLLHGLAARPRPDKPVDAAPAPVVEPPPARDVVPMHSPATTEPVAPSLPNELFMDDRAGPDSPSEPPAPPTESIPLPDGLAGERRRHPLRFTWAMDGEGRFSFGAGEFTDLIGAQTAAAFARLWSEVNAALALDPDNRVTQAVASRETFSNIPLQWPVDGLSGRLPVEMSGLPVHGHDRAFTGYRGFGICRDLDGLTRAAAQRRHDTLSGASPAPASTAPEPAAPETIRPPTETAPVEPAGTESHATPPNVVQFRPANDDARAPALTPGENNAFQELARQLSARLESETEQRLNAMHAEEADDSSAAQPHDDMIFVSDEDEIEAPPAQTQPVAYAPQSTSLYDQLPSGVLVYRADRLLYANPAFLAATGYPTLAALNRDGGLGALYVGSAHADTDTTGEGTPIKVSTVSMGTHQALDAKLHTIDWDGESALALILSPQISVPQASHPAPVAIAEPPPPVDERIEADELATILETTAEGVVMFDGDGRIIACNRSAEALFGRDSLEGHNLSGLFAPESQRAVLDYLDGIRSGAMQGLFEQGRDVLGRAPDGGAMALSITMGRTRPNRPRYFAVFRDKTPAAPRPDQDKRAHERAANAKTDLLARLSHEMRTPVNAIIGFADVMIEERFGALGVERYADYMKDIRASGERVISIIDDMLDLSRIESGRLDLEFAKQDLNALVEQCVGVMQPQANRERIIIRSSLTHGLPNIQADARALRQIALTLIGCAIHLAKAGGQVIVSTALNDLDEVALRIRDTGHGMNDHEIAAAMAPFRTPSPTDEVANGSGTNLSLAKALVEANRGRFHLKSSPNTGTLIEVVFSQAAATA